MTIRHRTPHLTAKWLSVKDVAADLGMSRQGALNKLSAGEIPGGEVAFKTVSGKRRWRIDAAAYFAWREEVAALNKREPFRAVVYFIQREGAPDDPVKIGFSSALCLAQRLATLQIGNPHRLCVLATIDGGQETEMGLHKRFRKSRIGGEWFTMTDELREVIQDARFSRLTTAVETQ